MMRTLGIKTLVGAFCGAVLLSISMSASAATLQPGQGALSVNQGQGFAPVNSRVDANAGDSVMVGPGGSATVVYDDGCKVDVQPGTVATVAAISPCASGSYAADPDYGAIGLGLAAAGGAGLGIYEATKSTNTTTTSPSSP
jgi:hypothetical protein